MDDFLTITPRNVTIDAGAETTLRDEAAKLKQFFDRLIACRVAVEAEHRYPSGGEISYSIKVQLSVPGEDLVVSRQDDPVLLTAIQRAFDAARRQLQDHVRRLREPAAVLPGDNRARVTKLFTYEGFGFLETATGEEVYFHRNSVLNDQFDQLEVGTEVRFALGQGNKGPHASTVSPVGKPRRSSGPSKRAM